MWWCLAKLLSWDVIMAMSFLIWIIIFSAVCFVFELLVLLRTRHDRMIYLWKKGLFLVVSFLRLHLCFFTAISVCKQEILLTLLSDSVSHSELRGESKAKRRVMRSSCCPSLTVLIMVDYEITFKQSIRSASWSHHTHRSSKVGRASDSLIRKLVTDIWILSSARKSDGLIFIFLVSVMLKFS